MHNLTIARKLQLMIINAIVALCIVALTGFYGINSVSRVLKNNQTIILPSQLTLGDAKTLFVEYRLGVMQHIQNGSIAKVPELDKYVAETSKKLGERLDFYEKNLVSDDADKKLNATEKQLLQAYQAGADKALEKSRTYFKDAASEIMSTEVTPIGEKLLAAFDTHIKENKKYADEEEKSSNASARNAFLISLVFSLLGICSIAAAGLFLIRSIRISLSDMEKTITRIEELDFTARANDSKKDELGKMAGMLNRLLEKLQGNLKTIATSARQVASASTQMAETSDQVATASHQQSAAASDMAATVEEMTVSINHVGDRAAEANEISAHSGELAAAGEKTIGQTVTDIRVIADTVNDAATSIRELETQGNKISAVVAVIKEVADQTNLLALNAAIEAARAGEQGRGFAVVADEVRKLAERTAASTQEIAGTISAMQTTASHAVHGMENAVEKVAQGVARANDANESIQQIGSGSRSAVQMVSEITGSIREQGAATNNIAVQVEKIAQMAEQSSAASAESARAARELDRLAEGMQKIVSAYRL